MSATDRTTALNASETPVQQLGAPVTATRSSLRSLFVGVQLRYVALAGILALSAVLNTHRLAQNGYANTFYSAGVKSMLRSWHNFVFASFDPGGLISIDKPPLGLWLQALSAKVFGFAPLPLIVPAIRKSIGSRWKPSSDGTPRRTATWPSCCRSPR